MGEEQEMLNPNVVGNSVQQCCSCNEWEERCKKAEVRYAELDFELQMKKEHCEELKAKVMALEEEKFELFILNERLERQKVSDGKEGEIKAIVDLKDDNEAVKLMIENRVLNCEKMRAESKAGCWRDKYKKLESGALQFGMGKDNYEKVAPLGNKKIKDMQSADTSSDGICQRNPIIDVLPGKKLKKHLTFETEDSPSKKMSAPFSVIDIIDSDDEANITQYPVPDRQGSESIYASTCFATEGKESNDSCGQNNQDSLDLGEDILFAATPKRKRSCNVVTSDSESDDDDDNIPIFPATISEDDKATNTVMTRRRLMPLRKCVSKSQDNKISSSCRPHKAKYQQSIPTKDNADESEVDLSYSEDENMSDFIVNDSDISNCDISSRSQDVSNCDEESNSINSQDVQDGNKDSDSQESDRDVDFGKILSKIRRSKNNMKWEFEADMLAAFGKDPELCMKAVCALYRQQTSEEQMSKGALFSNRRGFSKLDAHK
ncbi:hypothetical protein Fmac_030772 [Flemingia macrophylla]|uniref:Uncharacterized protein n=1 Tax=Flemingia macrophylla TaxID=520843 RepID=A0ABD1L058_9FABA